MVAKIAIGKNIRGILSYNEKKVTDGSASLILGSGFACELEKLSLQNKVRRFHYLTDLKPTVKTHALHISLNFDASEKIDNEKMQQISVSYMEQIGFGEQPYLVYRHHDSGHQHVHIATVSITRDAAAISLHNIGREKSEPARKAIEKEFNLIVAESRRFKPEAAIKPVILEKVDYGHLPTKRAINAVISPVANSYLFTSIAELNAILSQFNVRAETGIEGSEMHKNKGLTYSIMDKQGEKVGVPVKASAFYSKPTYRNLERHFQKNEEKRRVFKPDLISRIDKVLLRYEQITKQKLVSELKAEGINLILRENKQGLIYGATFVDNKNKTVFNGSALGKSYSAKALIEKLGTDDFPKTYLHKPALSSKYIKPIAEEPGKTFLPQTGQTNYLESLLGKTNNDYGSSFPNRKRKRRRGRSL